MLSENSKTTELRDIYRQNVNLTKNDLNDDFDTISKDKKSNEVLKSKGGDLKSNSMKKPFSYVSNKSLNDMTDTFDIMNKEMQANDFFTRLIGINLSIEEDKSFDFDVSFSKKMNAFLPWEDLFYNGKSKFQIYSSKNFPDWLKIKNTSIILFYDFTY